MVPISTVRSEYGTIRYQYKGIVEKKRSPGRGDSAAPRNWRTVDSPRGAPHEAAHGACRSGLLPRQHAGAPTRAGLQVTGGGGGAWGSSMRSFGARRRCSRLHRRAGRACPAASRLPVPRARAAFAVLLEDWRRVLKEICRPRWSRLPASYPRQRGARPRWHGPGSGGKGQPRALCAMWAAQAGHIADRGLEEWAGIFSRCLWAD